MSVSSAIAATQIWNVETGDFLDGANWSPGFTGDWPAGDIAQISNSGTATMSGGVAALAQMYLGQNASGTQTGTFVQEGGDLVLSNALVVGRQNGTTGTYTMTGGTLTVGGSFRIAALGAPGSAQGTFDASGAGTSIEIAAATAGVGLGGTGTLTLSDSAALSYTPAAAFTIGNLNPGNADSGVGNGTVTVESGAQFAAASAPISLGVVATSTGVLNVNGGTVTAASVQIQVGTGTVNLNGGTLTTGSISRNATNASAAVNFNGGTVRASADGNFFDGFSNSQLNIQAGGLTFDTDGHAVVFIQGLSGAGVLTKTGGGTLTLAGASTYSGGTLINGGTLVVIAGGDLGAGTVTVASGGLLDFDTDFTLATAGLVLETGSHFVLDQNLAFAGLTIEGFSFAEGTYDYATLKASYGSIFADGGSGQITVVPEPSVLALLGLGAGAWIARRARRRSPGD